MQLHPEPFNKIKNRIKNIELRLYDEKRQLLKVGQDIIFTNRESGEKMTCKITGLYWFEDFGALVENLGWKKCGWTESPKDPDADMANYYPKEDIKNYGALGIVLQR